MRLGTLAHNTTLMSKSHLQVCKQPQVIKLVYAYNLVVLAFLTLRLGTLMSKPHLQFRKQQQTASGIKNLFKLITCLC